MKLPFEFEHLLHATDLFRRCGRVLDSIADSALGPTLQPPEARYPSAFCLSPSNSAWVIAPLSSNAFAFSISVAAPPVPTVART